MKMGEYIKQLRTGSNIYGKKWSQEELGKLLDPQVNRAAVNKWESGQVENIKRAHIQQMSELFGVNPVDLMCFDSNHSEENRYSDDILELIKNYERLNEAGKKKILEDISDMTLLIKYTDR